MVKSRLALALIVGSLSLPGIGGSIVLAQAPIDQAFPATAVIRGENIRLRVDPALETDDLSVMERGDEVTITGEAVAADGDLFYPVDLTATGESGWVRVLFIDPTSIVPLLVVDDPVAAKDAKPKKDKNANQDRTQKKTADAAAEPTPDAAAERAARRAQREADAAAASAAQAADAAAAAAAVTPTAEVAPVTVDATPSPAVEAPVAPSAAAITIAGEGSETSVPFTLEAGSYRVVGSMQVAESSDLVARLLDADDVAQRLFRETIEPSQPWSAETTVEIETAGEYTVKVSGVTDVWTIAFEPA